MEELGSPGPNSLNLQRALGAKRQIEFNVLKEEKLLRVKPGESGSGSKGGEQTEEDNQERKNYLRPSDSLRQR